MAFGKGDVYLRTNRDNEMFSDRAERTGQYNENDRRWREWRTLGEDSTDRTSIHPLIITGQKANTEVARKREQERTPNLFRSITRLSIAILGCRTILYIVTLARAGPTDVSWRRLLPSSVSSRILLWAVSDEVLRERA